MRKFKSKLMLIGASACLVFCSSIAFAADATNDQPWTGKFYDVMPNNPNVTQDYCTAHSLDTYQTTQNSIDKEVTASNGVKAMNVSHQTSELTGNNITGVYIHKGKSMLSGTYQGKPWKSLVAFYAQSLTPNGPMQGFWANKECKGFYSVGPATE